MKTYKIFFTFFLLTLADTVSAHIAPKSSLEGWQEVARAQCGGVALVEERRGTRYFHRQFRLKALVAGNVVLSATYNALKNPFEMRLFIRGRWIRFPVSHQSDVSDGVRFILAEYNTSVRARDDKCSRLIRSK